ncbi:MAG: hypothetical protein HQM16_12210 [Deltaproteobacteria bacterium]|nr:hypothetical protein [Deltaproteobacteria bacterium]
MDNKRKFHLVFGIIMLALGLYGIYDESMNTVDCLIGIIQPLMVVAGLVVIFVGIYKSEHKKPLVAIGVALFIVGLYGLYDEWYTIVDFVLGLYPPLIIIGGAFALVVGVRKLKT